MKWRVDEMTGKTEPYSDYANGTTSGVNSEWQTRVQYVFQTSITYGDFEVDMSSTAKVNLAAPSSVRPPTSSTSTRTVSTCSESPGRKSTASLTIRTSLLRSPQGPRARAAPRNGPTRPRCRSTNDRPRPVRVQLPSSQRLIDKDTPSSSASPPNWPFASARLPISTCPCWIC